MKVFLDNAWWDGAVLHQRGPIILPDDFDPKKLPKSAKMVEGPKAADPEEDDPGRKDLDL